MKVFITCLGTETNTFSNMPTGMTNFEETMLYHGDATRPVLRYLPCLWSSGEKRPKLPGPK